MFAWPAVESRPSRVQHRKRFIQSAGFREVAGLRTVGAARSRIGVVVVARGSRGDRSGLRRRSAFRWHCRDPCKAGNKRCRSRAGCCPGSALIGARARIQRHEPGSLGQELTSGLAGEQNLEGLSLRRRIADRKIKRRAERRRRGFDVGALTVENSARLTTGSGTGLGRALREARLQERIGGRDWSRRRSGCR